MIRWAKGVLLFSILLSAVFRLGLVRAFRTTAWPPVQCATGRRSTCSTKIRQDVCPRRRRRPMRCRNASAMACDGVPSSAPGLRFEPHEGGLDEGLDRIVTQTKAWVRDVVVRLRLCPFAEAVFGAERGVRYVVSPAGDTEELWADFLREVDYLVGHDREEVGTTLLMIPCCLGDLADFNDFCAWLEETVENDEVLVDQVLVACFHPKHAFQGLEEDDVLNYEKRSPHPTINLLRADMVDEYIEAGRTQGIGDHNARRLRSEGKDAVKAAFEATLAL